MHYQIFGRPVINTNARWLQFCFHAVQRMVAEQESKQIGKTSFYRERGRGRGGDSVAGQPRGIHVPARP